MRVNHIIAAAALAGIAAPAFAAGWTANLGTGEEPAYHYAVVEGPEATNANAGALALECHVEGGRPIWQLQVYGAEPGMIAKAGVRPEQANLTIGAIEIDGRNFTVEPLGAGEFLALSDVTIDGFAAVSNAVVEALSTGNTVAIAIDAVPDRFGADFAGMESTMSFSLDGAGVAIAEVRRACR